MANYNIALEIMCAHCINYEVCGGTDCQPKKDLKELIELVKDLIKSVEVNNGCKTEAD